MKSYNNQSISLTNSVYEGDPIVLMGDPMTNMDFTQEYLYGVKWGTALVLAGNKNTGIGIYKTT